MKCALFPVPLYAIRQERTIKATYYQYPQPHQRRPSEGCRTFCETMCPASPQKVFFFPLSSFVHHLLQNGEVIMPSFVRCSTFPPSLPPCPFFPSKFKTPN